MPHVDSSGVKVWYETEGAGTPLLLVAGIASDTASWMPIVPMLARKRRVILLDNRGAGRTQSSGSFSVDDMVTDAFAVLDALGIEKSDIAGHSLGGMIALRMAASEPGRTGRLVISACTPEPDAKSHAILDDLCRLYEAGLEPEQWFRLLFHWLFAPSFFENEEAVAEAAKMAAAYEYLQSPAELRRQISAIRNVPAVDLASIENRTLLLLGADDILVPPKLSMARLGGLPRKNVATIAGAGHSVHWDKPAETAAAMLDFLE